MKISKKSILALVMAAGLLLAMFAGCKASPSPSVAASPSSPVSTAPSTSPSEAPPEPGTGMDSWVPFTNTVTLTVPVYDRNKGPDFPTPEKNYWTDWVQENFGDQWNVNVEYIAIPRGDVMATYNTLIVAKQTPVIMMEYDYPKVAEWATSGAMRTINLDEFKAVAPNFYQAMIDNNQLDYTNLGGQDYFVLTERAYNSTPYTFATMVRQDWLDTLGKSNPKSYAEWTDVMEGIVSNGLTSIAPFGYVLPSDAYARNYPYRNHPVNEAEWAQHSSLGTASLSWEPTKKYLKRLNSEYNNGYISKEFDLDNPDVSGGDSQWRTNFVNGKVYNFGGYMGANIDWLTAFYQNNPTATLAFQSNYREVEPGVVEHPIVRADNPFGMIVGFSSLASEDQLKAAWMYMEWMLQPEVLFTLENGVEGVTYNLDADGLPVLIGDYVGPEMLNHNMNIDMTCVVHAVKKVGTIEDTLKATTPKGIPQDLTQDYIAYYGELKSIADNGWAYTDPIFAVDITSEPEYTGTLKADWPVAMAKLIKCKPEEFDSLYDQLSKAYLDAGYKTIIEERLAAYNAGNTTKLPK